MRRAGGEGDDGAGGIWRVDAAAEDADALESVGRIIGLMAVLSLCLSRSKDST